jgi:predicted anti-sigma-YlaC factor YlaD
MNAITCSQARELTPEYVLGTLDPTVSAAVGEHLAGHAGAHDEIAELGRAATALAYLADPATPPVALRTRILAAAASTPQLEAEGGVNRWSIPDRATRPAEPTREFAGARVRRPVLSSLRLAIAGWATAAVAVVALVAVVLSGLASGTSNGGAYPGEVRRALALAAQPDSRIALIDAGTGGSGASIGPAGVSPAGLAVIPSSGAGVLVMQGLARTEGSQVYEAWAIVGSSAPVPIGSFAVGADGLGWLEELSVPPGAQLVVALTKEPGPGATKPTLPIVASGTAAPR